MILDEEALPSPMAGRARRRGTSPGRRSRGGSAPPTIAAERAERPSRRRRAGLDPACATKPSVIAGLKWPPEMWPKFETMIPIARPFASATATMSCAADDAGAAADEDQREGADVLGDAAAKMALVHGRNATSGVGRCTDARPRRGYIASVNGVTEEHSFDVECPHCRKTSPRSRSRAGARHGISASSARTAGSSSRSSGRPEPDRTLEP